MIKVIQNYSLGDVKDSIRYLLDKASQSPEVREHAINITLSSQDKLSAIYDWVRNTVSYTPDPIDIELFTSPVKMVKDYNNGISLVEDCDGIALLSTALCRAIGIRANVVLVDIDGSGLSHAYCEAWSDKFEGWIAIDPSSEYPLGWIFRFKEKNVID